MSTHVWLRVVAESTVRLGGSHCLKCTVSEVHHPCYSSKWIEKFINCWQLNSGSRGCGHPFLACEMELLEWGAFPTVHLSQVFLVCYMCKVSPTSRHCCRWLYDTVARTWSVEKAPPSVSPSQVVGAVNGTNCLHPILAEMSAPALGTERCSAFTSIQWTTTIVLQAGSALICFHFDPYGLQGNCLCKMQI